MANNKSRGDSWGAATPLEDWLDWTLAGGEHHFLCSFFFFLSFSLIKLSLFQLTNSCTLQFSPHHTTGQRGVSKWQCGT